MKILYIPFSFDDSLGDLVGKVSKWQESYKNRGKELLTLYHSQESVTHQKNILAAVQTGNCQIYILSHGIAGDKLHVCNQPDVDEFFLALTIEEVAKRFQSDFRNITFPEANVIKLYFCDEGTVENKPKLMAELFRAQLGHGYQDLDIKYYTDVSISIPTAQFGTVLVSKNAVRQFSKSNELLCFNLMCQVGTPKDFRQSLNNSEVANAGFFAGFRNIKYPKFNHPMIQRLADELVKLIQSDKVLSKAQDGIISGLLEALPKNIEQYLTDSLTIGCPNVKLEMRINKEKLMRYLGIGKHIVIADELASSTKQTDMSKSISDDDETSLRYRL
jgi:hypothetical protein